MTTTAEAPADTTMMRIVHDALRRDVARAQATLTGPPRPNEARRRAIGTHVAWMVRFLHAHHAAEDDGLYPLVRARAGDDPEVGEVLDRMAGEHEAIASALDAVEATATSLSVSPSDRSTQQAVAALDGLAGVLLPHLREEEDAAMPITSRLITAAEWSAIEKEHNLDRKSMSDLGFEGHWLIDGAVDADRATVLGLVPPIQRFVLLHGFARRYRRHAAACWGGGGTPSRRVQLEGGVAVSVDADIDDVWELVRDVTRIGEWSHECVGATWLGGASAAVPGARFRGRNRAGAFRWGRECEVLSAEPYQLIWRTVPTARYRDSSEWQITLDETDGDTAIWQHFHVVRGGKVLPVLYGLLIPTHRDRTAALIEDLHRLGTAAGRSRPPG